MTTTKNTTSRRTRIPEDPTAATAAAVQAAQLALNTARANQDQAAEHLDKVLDAAGRGAADPADLLTARAADDLAGLRFTRATFDLTEAVATHQAATTASLAVSVADLVAAIDLDGTTDDADVRAALGDLVARLVARTEARNEQIRTLVAAGVEAGLPSAGPLRWTGAELEASGSTVAHPDPAYVGWTVPAGPVQVVRALPVRGREAGLWIEDGARYLYPRRPARAAVVTICAALGIDLEALEAAAYEAGNEGPIRSMRPPGS